MNMIKQACLMIGLSVILFISCKDKSVTVEVEQNNTPDSAGTVSIQVPQENDAAITLNNGVQWEVSDQTAMGIKEMQKTINNLPSAEEARNYPALKEELEGEFSEVYSNAGLTGDAMSQFDKYMGTIKLLVEDLGSEDAATRQQTVLKLKDQPGYIQQLLFLIHVGMKPVFRNPLNGYH